MWIGLILVRGLVTIRHEMDFQNDRARICEFDSVAEEVDQGLPEFVLVATNPEGLTIEN